MQGGGWKPVPISDFARVDVDTEAVVWPPGRSAPSVLGPTARVLLDVLDGEATVDEIAEDVSSVFELPIDLAERQVARALEEIEQAGLLHTSQPDPVDDRLGLFTDPPSP